MISNNGNIASAIKNILQTKIQMFEKLNKIN